MNVRYKVSLMDEERQGLEALLAKGKTSVRKIKRAQMLSARVAKDDISAEVELAKLYLTGEGVAKSCFQARLLLRAAAADGSAEAQQMLAQLKRRGCP